MVRTFMAVPAALRLGLLAASLLAAAPLPAAALTEEVPTRQVYTNNPSLPLSGLAEAGSLVTLYDKDKVVGTVTADRTGVWSFTPRSPYAAGSHWLSATATDAAGNMSPPSTVLVITVDTVPPPRPAVTGLGGCTTAGSPVITGTAEAGTRVSVFDGSESLGSVLASPDGTWAISPAAGLAGGPHVFTAKATDRAGNTGPVSAPLEVTVGSQCAGTRQGTPV